MSMWRDGHMRRSPRISALGAWKAHQPTPLASKNSMLLRVVENQDSGSGDEQGPPSRTRSRTKRKLQDVVVNSGSTKPKQAIENPKSNDSSADDGQPLVLKVKEIPKHDDHAICPDLGQPSALSYVPWMPEKRILERILDILQRRDTYEIFAEPVDPSEVEDYYEIIKEPMDFGTMRAKLHEGMYTNLEQFEHDVFLISKNAMHFNSSTTIYFRQARAIQELAKKVFHVLKTDPENFELEFSGMRRKCSRRLQDDAKGFNLCTGRVTNVGSSSMTIDAFSKGTQRSLSGPSNFRRTIQVNHRFPNSNTEVDTRDYDDFSGVRDARHTSLIEADRRCTYKHCMSYNEDDSIVSMIYGDPKPLILVNQQDISYRESLLLFVKNLGLTAQMIAKQKLQGWWQDAPFCQIPFSKSWVRAPKHQMADAFTSSQRKVNTLDTRITNGSQNFSDQHPGNHSVLKTTSDIIDLNTDGVEKTCKSDGMDNHDFQRGMNAIRNGGLTTSDGMNAFRASGRDKVLQNQSTATDFGPYPSATSSSDRDLNSSVLGVSKSTNKSTATIIDASKLDNQVQPSLLASKNSQSNEFELKLGNNRNSTSFSRASSMEGVSSRSQTNGSSSMHSLGSSYQAIAALEPNDAVSSLFQVGKSLESNQHFPSDSQFIFDLPFLKARLNQLNLLGRDRTLQARIQGSGTEEPSFDQLRYKMVSNSIHQDELSPWPFLANQ